MFPALPYRIIYLQLKEALDVFGLQLVRPAKLGDEAKVTIQPSYQFQLLFGFPGSVSGFSGVTVAMTSARVIATMHSASLSP